MRTLPLVGCGLLLVLVAPQAPARDVPDNRTIRDLTIPYSPGGDDIPRPIWVSGQVATVLRFEAEVDPAKTKLTDWEGRFVPLLIGDKKVVLEPRRNLAPDEALPLVVTLVDGTECSFLVKGKGHEPSAWVDGQVNVFRFTDSYDAVVSQLWESRNREHNLLEENERLKEEVSSSDYALATLLANGEETKTAFVRAKTVYPKNEEMGVAIQLFKGTDKAAAVVTVTNTLGTLWQFDSAYLTRSFTRLSARSLALRMYQTVIVPGESGRLVVVVDKSAFQMENGQLADLVLHVVDIDGVQRVEVKMDHKLVQK